MKLKNVLLILVILFTVISPVEVYAQDKLKEENMIVKIIKKARYKLNLSIYDYDFTKIKDSLDIAVLWGAKITILTDLNTINNNDIIISELGQKGVIIKLHFKYGENYAIVDDKYVLLKSEDDLISFDDKDFILIESKDLAIAYNNKFIQDSNRYYIKHQQVEEKYRIRVDNIPISCYYKSRYCRYYPRRELNNMNYYVKLGI
jgi:hypothetical protein